MSATVVFVPGELYDFAAEANSWAVALREEAYDLEGALARFRAGSGEFVPALPDHPGRIDDLAERIAALAEGVADLGAAAEEADRQGVRLQDLLLTASGTIRTADTALGVPEGVVTVARALVYSARAARSSITLFGLRRRWGPGPMPDIARVRDSVPGGHRMPRAQVRPIQLALYQRNERLARLARNARAAAASALRTGQAVTGVGRRIQDFMHNTPAGRVIGLGGRALGGVGVVVSGYDALVAFRDGDGEGAVVNAVEMVGGALMLFPSPVTVTIGGALVVGALLYDKGEAIGDWVGDRVDDVADVGRSVVEGAGRILGDLL